MAILRVRDENGNILPVTAIKGDKGEAGAGVHVGSYVGDGQGGVSRYIDLQSPNVKAVLLSANDTAVLPLTVVTDVDGVTVNENKVAWLVDAYVNGTMDLGVTHDANQEGVTYHYIAFVEEVAE